MRRQIRFGQYRAMDVTVFTVLLCVCELLIVLAGTRWFPQEMYTLSLTPAVTAIVLVRWGGWAVFPALAGAAVFCLASGAQAAQFLIYAVGNLLALALVPLLRQGRWKRVADNTLLAMLHGLITALLMQLGRGIVAVFLGGAPGVCIGFLTTDVLSTLFAVLLVWICRQLDGMLEEQKHYLIRVQEEMIRAGGMNG